jgi:hypothetical protein
MATSQTCCHLPGEMLNSAAQCADRARIKNVHPVKDFVQTQESNMKEQFDYSSVSEQFVESSVAKSKLGKLVIMKLKN